jgi:uncharacterized NAD(P)/FAD-binding protein YdhS
LALVRVLREEAEVKIAVVGGGASGVIAAIQLERKLGSKARITIFDPAKELGSGLAYSTDHAVHLLNVPAEKMSALHDRPEDFRDWLAERHPEALNGGDYPFVSRAHYRRYLQAKLPASVRWRREKVETIVHEESRWKILGEPFDFCVQATGYDQAELSKVWPRDSRAVVIAGSGLTAVDHWRRLRHDGYGGVVHFVSPRALLPLPHVARAADAGERSLNFSSPLEIWRSARELNKSRAWPEIADAIRPCVASVWMEWSERQRNQFRRHVRPYWEVIRHRLPATVHSELRREIECGRARLHRGRILKGQAWREFSPMDIIDATGAGLARAPKIEGGANGLFVIGPASKNEYWEVTAVPEIRRQAAALAEEIALGIRLC